ncbi:adenosine receptor A3 [Nematostella vectensis]|nr:adenosine receptor A3 [Nematostella vectensis]
MRSIADVNITMATTSFTNFTTPARSLYPLYADFIWCGLYALEACAIVAFNILTLLTFAMNRSLRRPGIFLLLNLAVCDTLVGLAAIPVHITWFAKWSPSNQDPIKRLSYLRVTHALEIFTGTGSIAGLVSISVERALAACKPFDHRASRSRVYLVGMGFTWILAVTHCFVFVYCFNSARLRDITYYYFALAMILELAIIVISYVIIFIKLRQRKIKPQPNRIRPRDKELGVALFIVTVVSLLTWLPDAVVLNLDSVLAPAQYKHAVRSTLFLRYSNSFVNPIVYIYRLPTFRGALTHMLKHCTPLKPQAASSQGTPRQKRVTMTTQHQITQDSNSTTDNTRL